MPQCVTCRNIFPPNYVEVVPNSKPDFSNEYPKECIFCKNNIEKVERETANGSNEWIMYTKEQCIGDYAEFLRRLKDSRNVKDILKKTEEIESEFKM